MFLTVTYCTNLKIISTEKCIILKVYCIPLKTETIALYGVLKFPITVIFLSFASSSKPPPTPMTSPWLVPSQGDFQSTLDCMLVMASALGLRFNATEYSSLVITKG
jgi:hypothetical protein